MFDSFRNLLEKVGDSMIKLYKQYLLILIKYVFLCNSDFFIPSAVPKFSLILLRLHNFGHLPKNYYGQRAML